MGWSDSTPFCGMADSILVCESWLGKFYNLSVSKNLLRDPSY